MFVRIFIGKNLCRISSTTKQLILFSISKLYLPKPICSLQFNCGDTGIHDLYRLDIYDKNTKQNRPEICKQRDPDNPLCQVLGKYSLRLDSQPGIPPLFNYLPVYPNFAANCPTRPPEYKTPPDC